MRPFAWLLSPLQDVSDLFADLCLEGTDSGHDQGELVGKVTMQTDPIADLLTSIRNALRARKGAGYVPRARLKEAIVQKLIEEGFIGSFRVEERSGFPHLKIELKYDESGDPALHGLQRVSKPSLRMHVGAEAIPTVRNGLGISILSTSRGVIVDREARKMRVGGEVLCSAW